jgi:rhodanese-related sulfurtransferase
VGTVAPKEAADELDTGAVLVDVREPEEWQHGHIDGSVPAPRGLLEFFADSTSPATRTSSTPAAG